MKPVPPIDDESAAELVRSALPQAAAGACPDENLLVGWAEGRLDAARTAAVLEHLTRCDDCRRVALAWNAEAASSWVESATPERTTLPKLVSDGDDWATHSPASAVASPDTLNPSLDWLAQHASASRETGVFVPPKALRRAKGTIRSLAAASRRRRWVPVVAAAAAAVLAIVGVALLRDSKNGPAASTDDRLVAAARSLASSRPDLFKDFAPIGAAERAALADGNTRGGLEILEPAGALLEAPKTIRWSAGSDGSSYAVVLARGDGQPIWNTTTRAVSVDFPTGAGIPTDGPFVLSVTATGPIGTTTASRAFSIATEAERAEWTRAMTTLSRVAPADVGPLLAAHYAIRRGYFAEAVAILNEMPAASRDAVANETLAYATRRLQGATPK